MEEKLEQYRLRKRRKQNWELFKTSIRDRIKQLIMPASTDKPTETAIAIENSKTEDEKKEKKVKKPRLLVVCNMPSHENEPFITSETDEENDTETASSISPLNQESKFYKYTLRAVFFLFWVTLYIIAIELKFGIVYLMISALVGICLNTRTGPKKEGEISAYSVFNENCEAIDGTLKAEQFEKELFYKPALGR